MLPGQQALMSLHVGRSMNRQFESADEGETRAVANERTVPMCYEFESYYTRALVAERLRRKMDDQKERRAETPTPAKPAQAEEEVTLPEPIPV